MNGPIGKYVLRIFLAVSGIVLLAELVIYFAAPVYDFPSPQPFSGDRFYNPYEGMESNNWKKANFHFHTRAFHNSLVQDLLELKAWKMSVAFEPSLLYTHDFLS